jgi:hypothetical protein
VAESGTLFPDPEPDETFVYQGPARYVCALCRGRGIVAPGFNPQDGAYAFGTCTGPHAGRQFLVREDVYPPAAVPQPARAVLRTARQRAANYSPGSVPYVPFVPHALEEES